MKGGKVDLKNTEKKVDPNSDSTSYFTGNITAMIYSGISQLTGYSDDTNTEKENKNIIGGNLIKESKSLQLFSQLNSIQESFSGVDKSFYINIPRIVVVGTQSSGKSSFLNSILKMNILPTGNQIVTRVPLDIQLFPKMQDKYTIVFGNYSNQGVWKNTETFTLNRDHPESKIILDIQNYIIKTTQDLAGHSKGISNKSIYLRIYSKNIPRLCLTDLPGLTMVACTDKGQPKDIKEQIRNMVKNKITPSRTIICCIIAARTDIETDLALDLVKEVDPAGIRTIGILTKVDLMNKNTDVSDYLKGTISKDLIFTHGYFAVMNLIKKNTYLIDSEKEMDYFRNHKVYKNILELCGTNKASNKLSYILTQKTRKLFPEIMKEMREKYNNTEIELKSIGDIPENEEDRKIIYDKMIGKFCNNYKEKLLSNLSTSIFEDSDIVNYAIKIKKAFIHFRKKVKNTPMPILSKNVDIIINHFNGNHMDYSVCPVTILENIIMNSSLENKPWSFYQNTVNELLEEIKDILSKIIESSLEDTNISSQFPELASNIKILIESEAFPENKIKESVIERCNIEKSYVWTDDEVFKKQLMKPKNNTTEQVIELYNLYVSTISSTMCDTVPKLVMYYIVNRWEYIKDILLIKRDDLSEFLNETNETGNRRKKLQQHRKILKQMLSLCREGMR